MQGFVSPSLPANGAHWIAKLGIFLSELRGSKLFFRVRDYKASHLMTYSFWSFGLEAKQGGKLNVSDGTYDR